MSSTPNGVAGDLRGGAEASPRVIVKPIIRPAVELAGLFPDPVSFRITLSSATFALMFGTSSSHETTFWLDGSGLDTLIGELMAAREQFRSERDARQEMHDLVAGLRSPVPDSEDDVPW